MNQKVPVKNWPFEFSVAEQIKQIPWCLWDPWSIKEAGDTDIAAHEFRLRFIPIAIHLGLDSLACEIGFSHIRRFVKTRVQTHAMDAELLGVHHLAEQARAGARVLGSHGFAAEKDGPTAAPDEAAAEPTEIVKSKDSGGTWRAWNRSLRTNVLRESARLYKEAQRNSDPCLEEIRRQGEVAKEVGAQGFEKGSTAFGKKHRLVESEKRTRVLNAQVACLATDVDEHVAKARENLISDVTSSNMPPNEVFSICRRFDRAIAARKRDAENEDVKTLIEYDKQHREKVLSEFTKAHPKSQEHCDDIRVVPPPCPGQLVVLHVKGDATCRDAIAVEEWQSQHSQGHDSLGHAATLAWQHMARLLSNETEKNMPAAVEEPYLEDAIPSKCWKEDECVCTGNGRVVWSMRNGFAAATREFTLRHPEGSRKIAVAGQCVIRFDPEGDPAHTEDSGISLEEFLGPGAHICTPGRYLVQPMGGYSTGARERRG